MNDYLFYQLKTAACLTIFYLAFRGLLSRETFHRFNRILLLTGIAAAFVLPVWVVTVYRDVPVLPGTDAAAGVIVAGDAAAGSDLFRRMLIRVAFWIALAGSAGALLRWFRSLWQVWRMIRRGDRRRLAGGGVLVRMAEQVAPFSWMRHIVVSAQDLADNGSAVLLHEQAHLRFGHSWDLLFVDMLCCLQWFNPAMWLLRSELRAIHEYEADAAVLAAGADPCSYQLLLIRKAVGGKSYCAANSFNHSKLKNRIDMMLREKSSRRAGAKALLFLPLLGMAVGAFAQTVYQTTEPERARSQTVVVGGDTLAVEGVPVKPLILVDGVKTESLDEISAADIESVSVFKDEAAVTKYGEEGKNGVIVVTRKKDPADGTGPQTVRVSVRNESNPATTSASGDGEIRVVRVTTVARSAGSETDSGEQHASVVLSTADGTDAPAMQMTVITTMNEANATPAAGALETSHEALAESGTASGAESDAARKALDQARAALAKSRHASQEALHATREKLDESCRAIGKACKGAGGDATVTLGGGDSDGSVKISGTIDADGRLILIDGKRATQKEMNRTLRKKVRRINIWNGEEAVLKFGEEARDGAIEIITFE